MTDKPPSRKRRQPHATRRAKPAGNAATDDGQSAAARLRDALRKAAKRPAQPLRTTGAVARLQERLTPRASISVFIAYAREDDALVLELKAILVAEGFEVHSDHDFGGGIDFEKRIRDLIATTTATLVVWSPASVMSDHVHGEAALARHADKLVAAHLDMLDLRTIPFAFSRLNSIPASDTPRIVRSLRERADVTPAKR